MFWFSVLCFCGVYCVLVVCIVFWFSVLCFGLVYCVLIVCIVFLWCVLCFGSVYCVLHLWATVLQPLNSQEPVSYHIRACINPH